MKNTSQKTNTVNKNNSPYFLTVDPKLGPIVHNHNGSITRIPNDRFGRWFLRTHYPHVDASKTGRNWYAELNPLSPLNIPGLIHPKREYQHLGIYRMLLSNCGILFDMGLGKTYVSIAFSLLHFSRLSHCISIVLCPPSVMLEWESEIKEHIDPKIGAKCVLAYGAKRKKIIQELRLKKEHGLTFIITTYDTVQHLLNELKPLNISAIFLDESQKIKNIETGRTKWAYALRNQHPKAHRFILSGTPSTTDPEGFYAQLEWVEKGSTGCPNFVVYKQTFINSKLFMHVCDNNGTEFHILAEPRERCERWLENNYPKQSLSNDITSTPKSYKELGYAFSSRSGPKNLRIIKQYPRKFGIKNADLLHRITQTFCYRVTLNEAMPELPPEIFMQRKVDMTPQMRKAYHEILDTHKTELEKKVFRFSDQNSPYGKLHQIANGFLNDKDKAPFFFPKNPKLAVLEEILQEIGGEKIIIWSPYLPQIQQTLDFLRKKRIKCVRMQGSDSLSNRKSAKEQFQKDAQVLVANPAVGGIGLNLQFSYFQIFLANWWKPDTRTQAIARQRRSGQEKNVIVIDIMTKGTMEVPLLSRMEKQISIENQILKPSDLTGEIK